MTFRDFLYGVLRLSNDVRAVRRGTVGKRLVRRALGRASGKAIGRITR
jgi:hypothetical protein